MPKEILFKIESIEETNFSIDYNASSRPDDIDFDIEGGTTSSQPERIIDVSFKITFLYIPSGQPVLHYAATLKFYIENFDDFVTPVNDQLFIDDFLRKKLIHISLHTIRGMLFHKTANTGLASCYLPLID